MTTEVAVQKFQLPAHLAAFAGLTNAGDLTSNVGVSFPILSLKGKVWAVVRGGERKVVLNDDNEPRSSIEAVLIRANPALSKLFYETGYVEGSTDKPDCYSNDGITPAADAQKRQAPSCNGCPHNAWGSKIGEAGQKLKSCTDSRRMALVALSALNDPLLLRIPAASLKGLAEYGEAFDKKGIPYQTAVTKLSFDPEASSPKVLFKFVRFINEAEATEVRKTIDLPVVRQITGLDEVAVPASSDVNRDPTPAPAAAPAAATADPDAEAKKAKAVADAKAKAKARVEAEAKAKAEADARAKAEAEAKAKAPAEGPKTADDLESALSAALATGN